MKHLIIFLVLPATLFAQDYLVNIKYSSNFKSNNYNHVGEFSLDAMLPFYENYFEAGVYAGDISVTLSGDNSINNVPIQKSFAGLSFYYNPLKKGSAIIPFVGIKAAYLFKFIPDEYYYSGGSTPHYPGFYNHETTNDFMAVISLGIKLDVVKSASQKGEIILGVDYQLRSFNLNYIEFYEVEGSDYLGINYHSEKMVLDSFLWSLGLQLYF